MGDLRVQAQLEELNNLRESLRLAEKRIAFQAQESILLETQVLKKNMTW